MICKWCGNSLSASQTTCKRCGKAVPALSDCGGFYDLVPNARNAANAQNAPVQNAPVTRPAVPTKAPAKKKPTRNYLLLGAAAVIAVAFILLFIELFTLQGRIVWLTGRVADLEDTLDEISEIVVIPSEGEDPDPTDPGSTRPGAASPKPSDPQPSEPAESNPAESEPAKTEPAESKPADSESTGNWPENE